MISRAGKKRGLFLDRDGTLVHRRHYPSRPEDLHLYDGIGPLLCTLQQAGFSLIVITNQSGLARGFFNEDDLQLMHEHLARELTSSGVHLDRIYYCPHHPDGVVPGWTMRCECRKPQPGMLHRAAQDLNLDLEQSWVVGDVLDDIEAGNRVGCRTVLVDLGTEALPHDLLRHPDYVARHSCHALEIIAALEGLSSMPDLEYRPQMWHHASSNYDGRPAL